MNEALLKQQYLRMVFDRKQVDKIDWDCATEADHQFLRKVESKAQKWIVSLTHDEFNFIANFEKQRCLTHQSFQKKMQKEIKSNYRTVINHGAGWYGINVGTPTSDGFSLSSQITKVRGKKQLIELLKEHHLWTNLNGQPLNFDYKIDLNLIG